GDYELYNDLWVFDVNTDTWEQVQTTGDPPTARTNSGMIYDPAGDRMILFGGNSSPSGLRFTPLSDTWTLDLETRTWNRVSAVSAPPARLFHAITLDSTHNKILVYSGGDENAFLGPFISDMWALDLGTLTWELLWEARTSSGDAPQARINAVLMDDPERSRVIMFGGHDDSRLGNSNDLWAFDTGTAQWTLLRSGDVYTGAGCSSFCSCAEDFVQYDLESPERRQYHTLVPIPDQGSAVLFGGTGDCGYIDDTWHLNLASSAWTEVQAPEQGVACARTGREICEELCF
ncbi:MAG: kelch repeat-containing protein, partial [Myxococcota bacterium]